MKTKLSKKLLSLLLAAMMIVTSVPIISVSAFGATEDAAVTEVRTAMKELETKLATAGTFTNVTPAYEAYVDCQEAIDAYTYGGEADALNGVADALRTAISNIGDFTGVEVNEYVPTFIKGDGTENRADMENWHEKGYNNILFSGLATAQFDEPCVTSSGGVSSKLYHASNIVALYDGVNEIQIPVVISSYRNTTGKAYNKNRYIISAYPGNAEGDNADGWYMSDLWNAPSSGYDNSLDWSWIWWYGSTGQTSPNGNASHAFSNYADGVPVTANFSTHSGNLPSQKRSGFINYTYSNGNELAMSNILRYKGTPANYEDTYQIEWIICNGAGDSNKDYVLSTAASPIRILNYKTLTDALAKNGNKMKTVQLDDFSEGGLLAYFQAMDAATKYNPNDYYNASTNTYDMDGTTGAVTSMKTLVNNMTKASTTTKNSADYAALRTAMADDVMTTYGNGQLTYTDITWNNFVNAYENAQSIMADVNNNGYISSTAATAAQKLTDAYNALEENVVRVDTSALTDLIDEILSYDSAAFTEVSYAPVLTAINNAKEAIWGSVDDYKVSTSAPEDSEVARQAVQEQIDAINAVLKSLKLSMDYLVTTTEGLYSLNSAVALKDTIEDPTAYTNYQDFNTAVNNGNNYALKAAAADFTSYTTQVNEYTKYVKAIVTAYANLKTSFIKLPNGYVALNVDQLSLGTIGATDRTYQQIDVSYTPIAIIMRTRHEGLAVDYGSFDLKFTTNTNAMDNNMLDSININATMPALGTNDDKNHITKNSTGVVNQKPVAMSDQQRSDYAGNLQLGEFSVENLRYQKRDANAKSTRILTLQDGTLITDQYQARQVDLDPILTSTEGVSADPAHGGVFMQASDDQPASVYIHGNQQVVLPDTTAASTLPDELPAVEHYIQEGYFGAVTAWNVQSSPAVEWAGYNYLTSQQNNGEKIQMQAYVVDMSYLVDLVNECETIYEDSAMYSKTSWEKFSKALTSAKTYDIDGAAANGDPNLIQSQLNTKYKTLKAAYEGLEPRTMNVTFTYKTAAGVDTTTTLTAPYASSLSTLKSQIEAIVPPTYVADYKTWTFTGWSPAVDYSAEIRYDMAFTAQYNGALNKANWDSFNSAKTALINALTDNKYTVESLNAAQAIVDGVTYFDLDSAGQAAIYADNQTKIDSEATLLANALSALVAVTYDKSVAEAVQEEIATAKKNDPDMYNNNVDFTYQETVTVARVPVVGLTYPTQIALNNAIKAVVEALQPQTYTIKLNGEVLCNAQYGANLLVASDGRYKLVDDLASEEFNDSAIKGWKYSYSAPSTGGSASADKFIFTAPSYGFIVKGDTNLTTVETQASAGNYVVKIVSGINNKVVDVINTTGTFTMPKAPAYPFYTFTGYNNGLAAGAEYTVAADTVIVANYTADAANSFEIIYYASGYDFDNAKVTEQKEYAYNELVSYTNPDAYCWAKADMDAETSETVYTILAYGTEYSFYACEAMTDTETSYGGLVALTLDEYNACQVPDSTSRLVDGNGNFVEVTGGNEYDGWEYTGQVITLNQLANPLPVYSGGTVDKFNLIGSFVLPDGYSIVETGFIFATDASATNLTIENCNNAGIFRYKTTKHTVGNQFAIAIKDPGRTVDFKYAAYAIVKDAEGNFSTYYANPITANNVF